MASSFRTRDVCFPCSGPPSDEVKDLLRAYNEACEACEAVAEMDKKQAVQARWKVEMYWRHLTLVIQVPFLNETLEETPALFMHDSLVKRHWWDDPSASEPWNNCRKLLHSSPKLRYIVRAAQAGKEKLSEIDLSGEQVVTFKNYDKIVFAAREPLFAFCIYIVLLQSLSGRYGNISKAKEAIKPLWSSQHALDIAGKFQRTPEECNRAGEHSVDIVVLLTRVDRTGFTLTKADRLIMADVDPSSAHNTQLQMRIRNITDPNATTFVQLLSESLNIEETILKDREQGILTMGNVIPLPSDNEFKIGDKCEVDDDEMGTGMANEIGYEQGGAWGFDTELY